MRLAASPPQTSLLRHSIATLAYRASKALRGTPSEFAAFRASPGSRTPVEILAHMGDLFDWAVGLTDGKHVWHDSAPLAWDDEVARFFRTLEAFDRRLASADAPGFPEERLFQGPIADALTHTGQISLLRRMAGCPARGENYFKAQIDLGCVGIQQAAPKLEWD